MAIDIGRIAYETYSQHAENTVPWEDIGKVQQDAWRHAAVAVLNYMDEERFNASKYY